MVEYPDRGPVVLHSYLDPRDAVDTTSTNNAAAAISSRPGSAPGSSHGADPRAPRSEPAPTSHNDPRSEDAAPPLVGVVVAGSADEAREARRASARLERVGREIQKEWAAESSQERANEDGPE